MAAVKLNILLVPPGLGLKQCFAAPRKRRGEHRQFDLAYPPDEGLYGWGGVGAGGVGSGGVGAGVVAAGGVDSVDGAGAGVGATTSGAGVKAV